MAVFRTPDDRFRDLSAYPFEPHYHPIEGPAGETLRTHYVDTGVPKRSESDEDPAPVVCLHGEPTWSYMYRTVIPPVAREHRVVAPDFVGFGRSDKLTSPGAYSLELGVEQLRSLLDTLDLAGVTLVVHDWGGLIGLAYAAHYPERIARLVILNTFLPVGDGNEKSRGFLAWRRYVEHHPDLPVGDVMKRAMQRDDHWSDALQAAYDAPFPTPEAKAGAATWPLLIPMSPDTPLARTMQRTRERLARWSNRRSCSLPPTTRSSGRPTPSSGRFCQRPRTSRRCFSTTPVTSCRKSRGRWSPNTSSTLSIAPGVETNARFREWHTL